MNLSLLCITVYMLLYGCVCVFVCARARKTGMFEIQPNVPDDHLPPPVQIGPDRALIFL